MSITAISLKASPDIAKTVVPDFYLGLTENTKS